MQPLLLLSLPAGARRAQSPVDGGAGHPANGPDNPHPQLCLPLSLSVFLSRPHPSVSHSPSLPLKKMNHAHSPAMLNQDE